MPLLAMGVNKVETYVLKDMRLALEAEWLSTAGFFVATSACRRMRKRACAGGLVGRIQRGFFVIRSGSHS